MKRKTIIAIYKELNQICFNNVLTMPAIHASRTDGERGSYMWIEKRPVIHYNPRERYIMAWSVMYHEMVHQFLEEIMHVTEDNHHGPIFWRIYTQFAPVYGRLPFLWI